MREEVYDAPFTRTGRTVSTEKSTWDGEQMKPWHSYKIFGHPA